MSSEPIGSQFVVARPSAGKKHQGAVPLRVGFEEHMPHFTFIALKVYLLLLMRTIFWPKVALTNKEIAKAIGATPEAVGTAIHWLADPTERSGEAAELPAYIRLAKEPASDLNDRKVRVIYIENWINPAEYWKSLKEKSPKRKTASASNGTPID